MAQDVIRIRGLKVETVVGVPDEEREASQLVHVNAEIRAKHPFAELNDEITGTVNYFEVTEALKKVAGTGERKLIETLANDLAREVLTFENVQSVRLEVRKFILPETDYVSVETELGA